MNRRRGKAGEKNPLKIRSHLVAKEENENENENENEKKGREKMCGFLYALVLLLSVVDCLQTSGVTRGGSGIQIGTSDRSAFGKATGYGGRGHSGVKLGEARFPNSTRQRPYTTPSSTTTWFTYAPPSADKNGYNSTLKVSRNFIDGRGLKEEVLSIPSDLGSR